MNYSPQAPLSRGFFRQEYWIGLSFPSPGDLLLFFFPGDLPDPGTKPRLLGLLRWQTGSLPLLLKEETEPDSTLGRAPDIRLHAWSPSPWTLNFVPGI